MFDKFDGDKVLQTEILDVLKYLQLHGHPEIDTHVHHVSGRNLFLRSPFRDERTASFSVMTDTNCWKDFGSGRGGGVLDLVCSVSGLPRKEAFLLLKEISGVPRLSESPQPRKRKEWAHNGRRSAIHITKVLSCFDDERLIRYAASRGIERALLERYCYQITFYSDNYPGLVKTLIGFANVGGGYAYRGPESREKGCSTGNITTISAAGKYDKAPSCDKVIVFEGFFDFLSYLQYNHDRAVSGEAAVVGERLKAWCEFVPGSDVVVLNSVNNRGQALEYIGAHETVNCCFDNDKAGRDCFDDMCRSLPGKIVIDRSGLYSPHNDFNEYLMSIKCPAIDKHKSVIIK